MNNTKRYFTPLFQRQLLALLLQNPDTYERFPGIWSHTYFDETHHRQIAHAYIKIRLSGGEHPTSASLFQELFKEEDPRAPVPLDVQNLRKEAEALFTVPTANIDYSLTEVRLWAQNQASIQAINESVDLLQAGKPEEMRQLINQALEVGRTDKVVKEGLDDLLPLEIDTSTNILGHRFLERGSYATMIGSSGIGKSVAAMQIALEAACGQPALGIPVPRPLRIVLVQAEDSKNDRIEQVRMARKIADTSALLDLTRKNFTVLTTTSHRGDELFSMLENSFGGKNSEGNLADPIDLFIFNPAFAFLPLGADVNDAEDVGKFLRSGLAPFLDYMGAAGIVVHHTSKLIHRDTSKWSANTFMYSGHGSAEWTNCPRAVLLIEPTNDPKVWEFRASKRGSKSGYEQAGDIYHAYFRYSTDPAIMYFEPASPEDIDSATSEVGVKDEDILSLFSEARKTLGEDSIGTLLRKDGLEENRAKLRDRLKRLVKAGKLFRMAETIEGEVIDVFAREKPEDVFLADRLVQEILRVIKFYAGTGVNTMSITTNVKKRKAVVIGILNQLVEKGYARMEGNGDGKPHTYFPVDLV
jgi:hypothetical protein